MKRLNKEYSLNINDYIDVKYGSVNREKPLVIYVEGKAWIKPDYDGDYNETISHIMTEFKTNLKRKIYGDSFFENKFVFDFDVKTASLRENKKSFMSFEFFLKQHDNDFLMLKDLKNHIMTNYKSIVDSLVCELENHTFSLSKTKR